MKRNPAAFLCILCVWVMVFGSPGAASAQDELVAPAAAVEPAPISEEMSLRDILQTGGIPMYLLGVMSVVGLAMTLYFLVTLRESQVIPEKFIAELREHLREGRTDDARMACARNRSALAEVALYAMEQARTAEDAGSELLKEAIEGEGGRQATSIQNQIQYLQDIAVIAPMIGLLGTVLGMLKAFNTVALDIAKAKPMVLAGGVSQALITTAAGLIVGIPAMVVYAYFRGRSATLVSGLESASGHLLTLLSKKPSA